MYTPLARGIDPRTDRSDPLLSIDVDATSPSVSVRASGDLDIAGSRLLDDVLEPYLRASPSHIELDLEAISFIDSSGATALVALIERIRQLGGAIEINRRSEKVVRIFEILGIPI